MTRLWVRRLESSRTNSMQKHLLTTRQWVQSSLVREPTFQALQIKLTKAKKGGEMNLKPNHPMMIMTAPSSNSTTPILGQQLNRINNMYLPFNKITISKYIPMTLKLILQAAEPNYKSSRFSRVRSHLRNLILRILSKN